MAGLEGLASVIYHEKQQPGSMLCAQHALNSLLQGAFFTAPDLSEIARKLDQLEEQYNIESRRGGSKNMDDTGFFSVQVIEEAIEVWGLNLVRWRSNAMKPYQDHPHTQLAFILNFEQHWFTLRRFGPASSNIEEDPGKGHWFNLNSSLSGPEWVGRLYLGMVLQQAESEGYSVFVVTQADPSLPLALSRTEADELASTLPEPRSASQSSVYNATTRVPNTSASTQRASTSTGRSSVPVDIEELEGVEDVDFELQAALQASLMGQEDHGSYLMNEDGYIFPPIQPPPLVNADPLRSYSGAAAGNSTSMIGRNHSSQPRADSPDNVDPDPVAASMERNRILLRRMREQQEFAQRELWSSNELTPEQQAIQDARRQERLRQQEEEAEQLKKAIAESEAMARERQESQGGGSRQSKSPPLLVDAVATAGVIDHSAVEQRNYDDEDAELQAALRASLENYPDGWQRPVTPQLLPPGHQNARAGRSADDAEVPQSMDVDEDEEWHSESEVSDLGDSSSKVVPPAAQGQEAPSLEEIRLARLARFGS